MRQSATTTALMFLGLLGGACGGTPSPPTPADAGKDVPLFVDLSPGPDVRAEIDAQATDVEEVDRPSIDHPTVADVTLDTGPTPCTSNEGCAGDPGGPVCDTTSGRCVPCTAASDRCPQGQYCVAGMNRCAPGCRDDASCRAVVDGGVVERRCDPDTHTCLTCLRDEHCTAGNLCVGNLCVPGCNAARPCPSAQTCCGGACVEVQTNTSHCGACDRRCAAANSTSVCRAGACGLGACTAPYADCDGDLANGCETDTRTNVTACGACGAPCAARPNSTATCEAGACRYACAANFGDCDGDASNGCETDLRTTTSHCGMCGRACSLPNATAACTAGACAIATCASNFGDCNGAASDGCEVDTRTSVAHCGSCGRACSLPNATATCSAGSCAIGSCASLYGNCDGDAANGCEASLLTTASCGACGTSCTAGGAHTVGRCQPGSGSVLPRCALACEGGWTDCNANLADGCEAMGSCTVERSLFSDNFAAGTGNWVLSNSGTAAFGISYAEGYCRNPTHCFGCAVCIVASSYCPNQATATLRTTFDFTRVLSGTLVFYSLGSPGASDRFIVQATSDGGVSWTSLSTPPPSACCINTASAQWVDLTPVAGARAVQFRFLFDNRCDSEVWSAQWYVDDVSIAVRERNY
jgi:hypothetical protein